MIPRKLFDPRSIGNLALWLDASDAPAVGVWLDKSGNGRNAAQLATNNQPALTAHAIAGRPALSFDGINDTLSMPTVPLAAWHAFAVVSPSIASARTVLHLSASATQYFSLAASTTGAQVITASGSPTTVSALYGVDTRIGAGWDGGALKSFFGGLIGEIVVYSAALSADQAAAVTRYLSGKWGL